MTTLVAVGVAVLIGLSVSTFLLLRVQLAMRAVDSLESQVEIDRRLSTAQRLHALQSARS